MQLNKWSRTAISAAWMLGLTGLCQAAEITSPTYFDGLDSTLIDFEEFPGGGGLIPIGTNLSDQFFSEGVVFLSEGTPGSGSFDTPWIILASVSGGGMPSSGQRYASGHIHLGFDTSAMRIDFIEPVAAFGAYFIDHDFSNVRVRAFDSRGKVIEQIILPKVDEGDATYNGIAAPGIAAVIIDEMDGGELDSTFIDDLEFSLSIDEPACPADLNDDGTVDTIDLLALLGEWGACPGCDADLNRDDVVDTIDLLTLLGAWGACE